MTELNHPAMYEAEWKKYLDLWLPFPRILYSHIPPATWDLLPVSFSLGCPQNAAKENYVQNLAEEGLHQYFAENKMEYAHCLIGNERNQVH